MGKIRVSLFVSIICAVLGVAYFVYLLVDYLLKKKKQTLAGATNGVNVEVQAASETIEDKQEIPKGLEQTSKEESETPEENKTDKKA